MYRPQIRRKKSGAPVLSRKEIDDIGENLVKDFNPSALITPQEIDIDLLAQDYLGMEQDFQYLSHCGVYLGMTVFNNTDKVPVYDPNLKQANYISAKAHTVIIDNTLLAENQQHRYRFTMGHEVSHDFPMVQCRVDSKKLEAKQQKSWTDRDWMEWQANALSSAILMPKSVVLKVAGDVAKGCTEKHLIPYAEIRQVSEIFNVSFEAAMYRLKELKVLSGNFVMNKAVLEFWELII